MLGMPVVAYPLAMEGFGGRLDGMWKSPARLTHSQIRSSGY